MKKLIIILTLVIFSASFLAADVYIKSTTHTDGFEIMGQTQPAKDEIQEQWIGEKTFATITPSQKVIVDLNKNKMFIVYDETKSYVEASLPLDITKLLPEQAAGMAGMMKMTVKVSPSGETKKIGNWNCKGYNVDMSMMMVNMKMLAWASTDVPFDWKAYSKNLLPQVMKTTQIGIDDAAIKEFMKIEGYQVATDMTINMMGNDIKSKSEVIEITKKAAPAGMYEVPAGYTKQEKLTVKIPGRK